MATLAYSRGVNPGRQLLVFPSNPHPEKQEMNVRHQFVQTSGGMEEIAMIFVRMKPRGESDHNCSGRNTEFLTQGFAGRGVGLHLLQVEAVWNRLHLVGGIAELLVRAQRSLRAEHD